MRIWKGAEMEGRDKGKITLFVESFIINKRVINIIKYYANKEKINRIYLGAGKVDVWQVFDLNLLQGFEIIMEISAKNFHRLTDREMYSQIIVRVDCNENDKNLRLKTDNGKEVQIYRSGIKNAIQDVVDGKYLNDTILYG